MRKMLPKILLVGSFLCALLLVVLLNYGQTDSVTVMASFEPVASENCVTCHTSAETIATLAEKEETVSGGG